CRLQCEWAGVDHTAAAEAVRCTKRDRRRQMALVWDAHLGGLRMRGDVSLKLPRPARAGFSWPLVCSTDTRGCQAPKMSRGILELERRGPMEQQMTATYPAKMPTAVNNLGRDNVRGDQRHLGSDRQGRTRGGDANPRGPKTFCRSELMWS